MTTTTGRSGRVPCPTCGVRVTDITTTRLFGSLAEPCGHPVTVERLDDGDPDPIFRLSNDHVTPAAVDVPPPAVGADQIVAVLERMDQRVLRAHYPVGAYLPAGQLDGDCRCGDGSWPCANYRAALEIAVPGHVPGAEPQAVEHQLLGVGAASWCSCDGWKLRLGESITRSFDRHLLEVRNAAEPLELPRVSRQPLARPVSFARDPESTALPTCPTCDAEVFRIDIPHDVGNPVLQPCGHAAAVTRNPDRSYTFERPTP